MGIDKLQEFDICSSGKTSSADLLGLNFSFGGTSDSSPKSINKPSTSGDISFNRPMSPATNSIPGRSSPATSVTSVTSPVMAPPPRADRYAETAEAVTKNMFALSKELKLEVGADDVSELLKSHDDTNVVRGVMECLLRYKKIWEDELRDPSRLTRNVLSRRFKSSNHCYTITNNIQKGNYILDYILPTELSDILSEVGGDAPPALPPRTGGGSSSRGSTPTPTMAIPRPPSRKALEGPSSRGRQSPSTVSSLSHGESISSLEFRTSSMVGTSRGPSPLTIGLSDSIPLAVAFQELCHAYFRGTDESKCQIKVTGEMMVSFPAGIVSVLANNPSPAQLSFKVNNYNKVSSVLPNKQLIIVDEENTTPECGVFNFNMTALTALLRKQAESNPSASYFNVDMIKYQVFSSNGAHSSPLQLVSYWKCEDNHTDLRIDYKYNPYAIASPCALLNVNITVPVDGVVKNMQSKPSGQWLKDQQRAVWKLTELSQHSSSAGVGSLRAKFEVAAGPSTPATVSAQFNCEGTTVSGLDFALVGSGYRVSLIKKRFVSGKYICDADAVLRLRYGSVPS
ncbi:hypothetical protein SK128_016699 [Halocaridina rubra]|uniref:MHD domain-containing protein n=1 Tax=Halocaridina rubra TaxID=373956 RepID=A0AAN8X7D0_HALRR